MNIRNYLETSNPLLKVIIKTAIRYWHFTESQVDQLRMEDLEMLLSKEQLTLRICILGKNEAIDIKGKHIYYVTSDVDVLNQSLALLQSKTLIHHFQLSFYIENVSKDLSVNMIHFLKNENYSANPIFNMKGISDKNICKILNATKTGSTFPHLYFYLNNQNDVSFLSEAIQDAHARVSLSWLYDNNLNPDKVALLCGLMRDHLTLFIYGIESHDISIYNARNKLLEKYPDSLRKAVDTSEELGLRLFSHPNPTRRLAKFHLMSLEELAKLDDVELELKRIHRAITLHTQSRQEQEGPDTLLRKKAKGMTLQ